VTNDAKDLKVLVATDGSESAIDAAHRAVEMLRPGSEIVFVMVIPEKEDPMDTAGGFEGPAITEEEAEEDFERATAAGTIALERTVAAAEDAGTARPGVETQLVPADADAGHTIVEVANNMHADLVVVGSSGKRLFKRLFTGSVSDYVVHHAPCPVLVVRHDH
jgi:nucleotide-binding universal stress UspA family protein